VKEPEIATHEYLQEIAINVARYRDLTWFLNIYYICFCVFLWAVCRTEVSASI